MPSTYDPRILVGDCRDRLRELPDDSVDLTVTSPPYSVGKEYEEGQSFDDWQTLMSQTITELARVTRPGGFVAINTADILAFPDPALPPVRAQVTARQKGPTATEVRAAAAAHPDLGRRELAALLGCSEQTIDRRLNGNNARGSKTTPQTKVLPVVGLFTAWAEDSGLYLYDRRVWAKDPAWQSCRWTANSYRSVDESEHILVFCKPGPVEVRRDRLADHEWGEWGSRGVWSMSSVRANREHPAAFPLELPRRLIRLLSDAGDLVLDPFLGSGTVAEAALSLGREFLGCELTESYLPLIQARLDKVASQLPLGT